MLVENSGTQVAVIGTEHTLFAPTTAKTRALWVSARNLASGDTLRLRIKTKILAGGPEELVQETIFTGVVVDSGIPSEPFMFAHGVTYTLTQTAGTARSFDWRVDTAD